MLLLPLVGNEGYTYRSARFRASIVISGNPNMKLTVPYECHPVLLSEGGSLTVTGNLKVSHGGTTFPADQRVCALTGKNMYYFSVMPCSHDKKTYVDTPTPKVTCTYCGHEEELKVLENASDNTATISALISQTNPAYILLSDRTLTKNDEWNTLCLPFSLTAEKLAASPLAGATIKVLDPANTKLDNGKLTLRFTTATSIEAGKPYLIKWATGDNIVNPLFENVYVSSTAPTPVTSNDGKVTFVGQYSPFSINAGNLDKIIMLSSGNRLGYSQNPRSLKCFRCHFEVPNTSAAARSIALEFDDKEESVTGISGVKEVSEAKGDAWWTLSGNRLAGKPTASGIS